MTTSWVGEPGCSGGATLQEECCDSRWWGRAGPGCDDPSSYSENSTYNIVIITQ